MTVCAGYHHLSGSCCGRLSALLWPEAFVGRMTLGEGLGSYAAFPGSLRYSGVYSSESARTEAAKRVSGDGKVSATELR